MTAEEYLQSYDAVRDVAALLARGPHERGEVPTEPPYAWWGFDNFAPWTLALRRGLSTRYGQRRRQRAQGVARVRHERRRLAAWRLVHTIPETRALADRLRGRPELPATGS